MANKNKNTRKYVALAVIGVLTMLYSLAEIAAALFYNSLTLLSDGFHNLSDVIALMIAFWALKVFSNSTSEFSQSLPSTRIFWRATNILWYCVLLIY
jgi:Co/Zn/Cd efflux system component